VKRKAKKK